jgi:hypothetical protein
MILSFKQKFPNGEHNYFVSKIWAGLAIVLSSDYRSERNSYFKEYFERFGLLLDNQLTDVHPKVHTIRKDETRRWRSGRKIHFVINNRSKLFFRFAPVIKCKGVQRIFMTPSSLTGFFEISVDGRQLTPYEILQLARNDGFDSVNQMEEYFFPGRCKRDEWRGRIIHWTILKY